MTLTVRWAAKTDVGKARDRNEDSYFGGEHVFAVADGLGGHNAGDVASRIAIEPMKALDGRITGEKPERIAEMLAESVSDANRAVFKRAQQDAKVRGMGTTLTAVAVVDGSVHLAHVGDSRCYLIRDDAAIVGSHARRTDGAGGEADPRASGGPSATVDPHARARRGIRGRGRLAGDRADPRRSPPALLGRLVVGDR
jgi:serine/threonine protein phosphatase PrpC